jgi:hypothetical protein
MCPGKKIFGGVRQQTLIHLIEAHRKFEEHCPHRSIKLPNTNKTGPHRDNQGGRDASATKLSTSVP